MEYNTQSSVVIAAQAAKKILYNKAVLIIYTHDEEQEYIERHVTRYRDIYCTVEILIINTEITQEKLKQKIERTQFVVVLARNKVVRNCIKVMLKMCGNSAPVRIVGGEVSQDLYEHYQQLKLCGAIEQETAWLLQKDLVFKNNKAMYFVLDRTTGDTLEEELSYTQLITKSKQLKSEEYMVIESPIGSQAYCGVFVDENNQITTGRLVIHEKEQSADVWRESKSIQELQSKQLQAIKSVAGKNNWKGMVVVWGVIHSNQEFQIVNIQPPQTKIQQQAIYYSCAHITTIENIEFACDMAAIISKNFTQKVEK